ncbi:MAG: sigma-54 dependent transcriptional regulator [Wenzhouxiangellaceae bacterium]|nr:sigma-54 dependent transcriptional regulator [Wenzhouxiangellaceae bacterium]
MTATILIVDDEPDIRELIGEIVTDEGFEPVLAADAAQARQLRDQHRPDLILLDVWMPDQDGVSLLREWRDNDQLECPVIMISGHGSVEAAVEATRCGASDFIEKPVSMARLLATIKKALSETSQRPNSTDDAEGPPEASDPIGRSEATEKLRADLKRTLGTTQNILITGEPGTGRTNLARWIHSRAGKPGQEWITATGGSVGNALNQVIERLDSARRPTGTLLVERLEASTRDEQMQLATLLARLDSTQTPGLRIIATSVAGLADNAARGAFDTALFHQIAEIRIGVPTLRERREDIPELVRCLSERLPAREGLTYRSIPVAAQNRLRQHDWPGNIRELSNLVRQLLLTERDAPVSTEEVEQLLASSDRRDPDQTSALNSPLFDLPLREAREAFERQYLIARLKRVDGSVGQLAEAVEMERTHLYRKLRQLDIDPRQIQENK